MSLADNGYARLRSFFWTLGSNAMKFDINTNGGESAIAEKVEHTFTDSILHRRSVDGSEASWTTEIPREVVWRNIRQFFERFGIKVYVFRNSVEIRGFLPTEVMEIPDAANDRAGREAIIPSASLPVW